MIDDIRDKIYTKISAAELRKALDKVLKENNNNEYLVVGRESAGDWSYFITLKDPTTNEEILRFDVETIAHEVGGYHHTNVIAKEKASENDECYLKDIDSIHSEKPVFNQENLVNFVKNTVEETIYKISEQEESHCR